MKRARLSPSSSTTWSNEASHSWVSAGSMSGSWCLNSSKVIAASRDAADGWLAGSRRLEAEGRVEILGDHGRRRLAGTVLRPEAGRDALDRVGIGRRDRGGRQPPAVDVDRD